MAGQVVVEAARLPVWQERADVASFLADVEAVAEWCGVDSGTVLDDPNGAPDGVRLSIETADGTVLARPGDWVIRDAEGEFLVGQLVAPASGVRLYGSVEELRADVDDPGRC